MVSYSEKPDMMGSRVNSLTILVPRPITLVVILAKAVEAIVSNAENFSLTVSTPSPKLFILSFLPAFEID